MPNIGIDPGLKGGIAYLDLKTRTLKTWVMPVTKHTNGKTLVDNDGLVAILRSYPQTQVTIEDVWSSSQMGVVSSFSFGMSKWALDGVCAALGLPRRYVSPAKWKGDLGCPADKDVTKQIAAHILGGLLDTNPERWSRINRKPRQPLSTEGKCEAALIALWSAVQN